MGTVYSLGWPLQIAAWLAQLIRTFYDRGKDSGICSGISVLRIDPESGSIHYSHNLYAFPLIQKADLPLWPCFYILEFRVLPVRSL